VMMAVMALMAAPKGFTALDESQKKELSALLAIQPDKETLIDYLIESDAASFNSVNFLDIDNQDELYKAVRSYYNLPEEAPQSDVQGGSVLGKMPAAANGMNKNESSQKKQKPDPKSMPEDLKNEIKKGLEEIELTDITRYEHPVLLKQDIITLLNKILRDSIFYDYGHMGMDNLTKKADILNKVAEFFGIDYSAQQQQQQYFNNSYGYPQQQQQQYFNNSYAYPQQQQQEYFTTRSGKLYRRDDGGLNRAEMPDDIKERLNDALAKRLKVKDLIKQHEGLTCEDDELWFESMQSLSCASLTARVNRGEPWLCDYGWDYNTGMSARDACCVCGERPWALPECRTCPAGTYSNTPGASACVVCEAGKARPDKASATGCSTCGAGTYSPGLACEDEEGFSSGYGTCDDIAEKIGKGEATDMCDWAQDYQKRMTARDACCACGNRTTLPAECRACGAGTYSDYSGALQRQSARLGRLHCQSCSKT